MGGQRAEEGRCSRSSAAPNPAQPTYQSEAAGSSLARGCAAKTASHVEASSSPGRPGTRRIPDQKPTNSLNSMAPEPSSSRNSIATFSSSALSSCGGSNALPRETVPQSPLVGGERTVPGHRPRLAQVASQLQQVFRPQTSIKLAIVGDKRSRDTHRLLRTRVVSSQQRVARADGRGHPRYGGAPLRSGSTHQGPT